MSLITASKINKIKIKQKNPNGLFTEDNLLVYIDDQLLHGKATVKIAFDQNGIGQVAINMFAVVDVEDLLVPDLDINVVQTQESICEN